MINDTQLSYIWDNIHGLWIDSLYDAVEYLYAEKNNDFYKEAFLWILEKWLREGKINFLNPDRFQVKEDDNNKTDKPSIYWNATPEEITQEFREYWPSDEEIAEDDFNLDLFFYGMPNVVWILADGKEIIST